MGKRQFQQRKMRTIFLQMLFRQLFLVTRKSKKLPKRRSYEKGAHKTLMKLAPGVKDTTLKQN